MNARGRSRSAHRADTFATHDGVALFYRHWPALAPRAARRDRAVPSRPRALGADGASRRRARPARLRLLRLGCARPRPLARRARLLAELRHVGARRADVRRPYRRARTDSRPRSIAVVAQSVGAVLAATWVHDYAPPIRALVLASPAFKVKLYVPFALPGLRADAQAARQLLRQQLRQGEVPDARSGAHRIYDADPLITRPISVNILLGLYEAAERVVADAAAITVPTQLLISGADWVVHHAPQHDVLRPAGQRHEGEARAAGLLSRHARRARPRAGGRPGARRSCCASSRGRLQRPDLARRPLARLHEGRGRCACRSRCRRCRRAACTGRRRARACGSAARCPRACGSAMPPASIRAARSTTSTATQPAGATPLGRADRPRTTSTRSAGAASASASCMSRSCCARRCALRASAALPVRIVDIAAGHGRYVLEAVTGRAERPDRSCCATTATSTCATARR